MMSKRKKKPDPRALESLRQMAEVWKVDARSTNDPIEIMRRVLRTEPSLDVDGMCDATVMIAFDRVIGKTAGLTP